MKTEKEEKKNANMEKEENNEERKRRGEGEKDAVKGTESWLVQRRDRLNSRWKKIRMVGVEKGIENKKKKYFFYVVTIRTPAEYTCFSTDFCGVLYRSFVS
jgi:hypothetical protein